MIDLKKFRKVNRLTQTELANYLCIGQPFISQIEKGIRPMPSEYISKLLANKTWDTSMLTGEGEMLKTPIKNEAKEISDFNFVPVPLVPIRAKAGYLVGFDDAEYIETLPTVPVLTDRTFHGKYRCFEVDGDSMDNDTRDALCDKDVVLAREVKRELWQYKLHYKDWNFVIVHKEGILIKRIVAHDTTSGIITCHSLNPIYGDDFQLNLADVFELYNVIKIVERNAKL